MAVISKKKVPKAKTSVAPDSMAIRKSPRKSNSAKIPPKSPLKAGRLPKQGSNKKASKARSGCIYVKHLPIGFTEAELRAFFEQFGTVKKVCVARSKRTQQSQGYGYVVFHFYEVAEIAASAVNNYLMFGKMLKAGIMSSAIKSIPRRMKRAFASKDEHAQSYKKWLKEQISQVNDVHVGSQRLRGRQLKQLKRLKKTEEELHNAGLELPEIKACVSKLQKTTEELIPVPEHFIENPNIDEEDDDDENTVFRSLQPSDWDTEVLPDQSNEVDDKQKQVEIVKAEEVNKKFASQKLNSKKDETNVKRTTKVQPTQKLNSATATPPSKKKAEGVSATPQNTKATSAAPQKIKETSAAPQKIKETSAAPQKSKEAFTALQKKKQTSAVPQMTKRSKINQPSGKIVKPAKKLKK